MNHLAVAIILGIAAGFGGAWLFQTLDGGAGLGSSTSNVDEMGVLRAEIADLRRELQDVRDPPATLTTREPGTEAGPASADAVVEAVLARLDERVGATVETKFEELASRSGEARPGRRPRGKKRVSLREAADALALTRQQEDDLLRVYQESQDRMFKLAAGEDGDVEQVRREVEEAKGDPAAGRTLFTKYMPNVLKNLGQMMTIQAEREASINKILGPDKAKRLKREFDVKEDNVLGMGGEMRVEGRMDAGGR